MFISRFIGRRKIKGIQNSWSEAFGADFVDYDAGEHSSDGCSSREVSPEFCPMEDWHADDGYSVSTFIDSETTASMETGMASVGTGIITNDQKTHSITRFSGGTGGGWGRVAFPAPAASPADVKLHVPSAMVLPGTDTTSTTLPPPSSAASSVHSGGGDSQLANDKKEPPSMTSSSPGSAGKAEEEKTSSSSRPLPNDFVPNDYSVIVGRGKKVRQAAGNLHLRTLCSTYLSQYSEAMNNKPIKTEIVNSIISIIRAVCPDGGSGAFIRMEDGVWCEVSDRVAREKVGYVFRDLLHDKYESSAQSKAAKKKRRLSSASSVHSRSSVLSISSSTTSLVQHEQSDIATNASATGLSSQQQDHAPTLHPFEPANVPSSNAFSGSVSGYTPTFPFPSISPLPLSTIQQQQQQHNQPQQPYDKMMMPPMPMAPQMMPNLQYQQPQYTGSSMMGSFPQQMQQQNIPYHQAAFGQNWNPRFSGGTGSDSGHQDQQLQQQRQQQLQQQNYQNHMHFSSPYDHQQIRHQADDHLSTGDASAASADRMMMMMTTMMEPSPIMSNAGHMDHSQSTTTSTPNPSGMEQRRIIRPASQSLPADEMAQLFRNSDFGRGVEDDSSSSILGSSGNGRDEHYKGGHNYCP